MLVYSSVDKQIQVVIIRKTGHFSHEAFKNKKQKVYWRMFWKYEIERKNECGMNHSIQQEYKTELGAFFYVLYNLSFDIMLGLFLVFKKKKKHKLLLKCMNTYLFFAVYNL